MESRNATNGWDSYRSNESRRSSRRSGRRHGKSTVSSRLNPDFNPKDNVKNESSTSNSNNAGKSQNNDELDPKTMNFDELVNLLHPSFILDYLTKILSYLRSDKTEISFPNIAPYKEAFLMKIVDNNHHLQCSSFNENCKTIANQILDVLHVYRHIYKWTYQYESPTLLKVSKSVLVYKKFYLDHTLNSNPFSSFKEPCMEALNINSRHEKQESIPTGFKIQTLNATLKFVKDDNQFALHYQEMPRNQAEFLKSLLSPPYHRDSNVGFGFKSLYSSLFDAMRMGEKRYEFRVSFIETVNNTIRVTLQKIPKLNTSFDNLSNESHNSRRGNDHNTSNASASSAKSKHLTKAQKDVESKRKMIESLPENFIRNSLQSVLNFISDEGRASLEFRDIVSKESRFLECVTSLSRRKDYYQLFSEESEVILKRIDRAYRRESWKLQVDVGKLNKRTKQRDITFFKVPNKKGSGRRNSISERAENTRNGSSCSIDSVRARDRSISKDRRSASSTSERNDTIRTVTITNTNHTMSQAADRGTNHLMSQGADRGTNHMLSQGADRGTNHMMSQGADRGTNHTMSQGADRGTNHMMSQAADRGTNHPMSQGADRGTNHMMSQGADRGTNHTMSQGADRGTNHAMSQGADRGTNHAMSQGADRGTNHAMSQGADRGTPDHRHDHRDSRRRRSTSRDRKAPRNSIAFQSAGAQIIDATTVTTTDSTSANIDSRTQNNKEMGLTSRKNQKLMVAMSTPLESDRAERMMRLMGWEGGALGVRGEGITEPIIPALHLAPGAGLGHVKPVSQRSAPEFRRHFLQHLLTFIQSPDRDTAIVYQNALSKKEARFVKPAVSAMNDRKNIGLSRETEMRLVKKLLEEFMRDRDLVLNCQISENKKEVHITKLSDPNHSQRTSRRRRKRSKMVGLDSTSENRQTYHDIPPSEILNTSMELDNGSSRSAKVQAYRVMFMQKIKEFVQIEDPEKEYVCDCILNTKQRGYIQGVIANINKREARVKYNSDIENDLYRDIRKIAGDCYMSVIFDSQKFILQKKYYRKRFTNSSMDLPPPKSKDVKNTTIYRKNDDTDNGSNHNGSSHNDNSHNGNSHNGFSHNGTSHKGKDHNGDEYNKRYNGNGNDCNGVDHDDYRNYNGYNDNEDNYNRYNGNQHDYNGHRQNDAISMNEDEQEDILFPSDDEPSVSQNFTDTTDSVSKTTDLMTKSTDLQLKTTENDEYQDLDDETLSIDISNESLMLDMLENEMGNANEEKVENISTESNSVKDIKALEQAILDTEKEKNMEGITENFKECHLTSNNVENDSEVNTNIIVDCIENSSPIRQLEINNNHNVVKDRNSDEADRTEATDSADSVEECPKSVESKVEVEFLKELSPASSKRSRSDSENSDNVSRKYKKVEHVHYICIAPENYPEVKINIDSMRKVQALISNEIDNCTFLPLLNCHGVKNGGLVYSCHNEKTFNWLQNTISAASDLNLKATETEFQEELHKLKIKISSFENVEKIFKRLEMYNTDLSTNCWQVTEVKKNRDFVIIHVVVDNGSYRTISRADFSLFAGVDKARFSVNWDP